MVEKETIEKNRDKKQTSEKGLNLIKEFEGCRLTAYQCDAGVWTIGYGHTYKVDKEMKIAKWQAEAFFNQDIVTFEEYVNNQPMSFDPNQNEFDALVSFTFNLGPGNLATLVKNRSRAQVADAILLYNKVNGKPNRGIERRRKEEKTLFLSK